MTDQKPKYRPQGVNYLGLLAKQLGDLRGPSSMAYELIQNADDAKDDSFKRSATQIVFDVRDDALIVCNDATFREEDFDRISDIASGSKRSEEGDPTTGRFGFGFISVYEITDRPEIHSAYRRWLLRPDKREDKRIKIYDDPLITKDKGTKFYLPWATEKSVLREKLRAEPITKESIEDLVEELKVSLPRAIIFLKSLKTIKLISKGKVITRVEKSIEGTSYKICCDGNLQYWSILCDAESLSSFKLQEHSNRVDDNRSTIVRVAIPAESVDNGILFATLPTKELTRLPFHIDADFFPASNRKSIDFEDKHHLESEWNREVIRVAAHLVRDNLGLLREMFIDNSVNFWAILKSIYDLREEKHDARIPLGVFWEVLEPVLKKHPIVYTESNKWLKATEVRMPVGDDTIDAFKFLGIEMVNRDLQKYHNILRSNGVRRLGIKDIYEALEARELITHPRSISFHYQSYERLELLWQGILAIYDGITGLNEVKIAKNLLRRCVLAPGIDGRIWPCDSVYQVDNNDTQSLFSSLLPNYLSFLDLDKLGEGCSLFEHLCPSFSLAEAIEVLEALEPQEYSERLSSRGFQSEDLVRWFSKREIDEDAALSERFVKLAIFPAGKDQIDSLEDLWMPGGFDDPLKKAQLLDMQKLEGLSDFLSKLGARRLTFIDYTERYIANAFGINRSIDLETKYKLFEMLERHFGEIREKEELRDQLIDTNIVECSDGIFRSPREVYFPRKEIKGVLGDHVRYCKLPAGSEESRRDLYKWLGVSERLRVEDVLHIIDVLTDNSPDQRTKKSVIRCLKAVDNVWMDLSDSDKNILKNKRWLPAESLADRWYRPEELYTSKHKKLFSSQACFLDAPVKIQEQLSKVLERLGIKSTPMPAQVANHLLQCSQENIPPPKGIYRWLNKVVTDIPNNTLGKLKDSACLYMEGNYLRPDQVFWRHDFGRFCFQLDQDMLSYSKLLVALGVKNEPDYDDALKLLKDIAREKSNNRLEPEEKDAVLQCWVLISRALDQDNLNDNEIRKYLRDIPCIPNIQEVLIKPSWMFFEDRPQIKDKFQLLVNSCIQRTERIWKGMEAAGVRPLSSAVLGHMKKEDIHLGENTRMGDMFTRRRNLMATILEGYVDYNGDGLIDNIRFFWADEIKVTWKLHAFNRCEESVSDEPAFFDYDKETIYYTLDHTNNIPWPAIAREIAYALARGERVANISPGIMIVLEANTYHEARMRLEGLGIIMTQELALEESSSQTDVVTFEEMSEDEATDHARQEDGFGEDDIGGDDVIHSNTSKSVSRVGNQSAPIARKFFGRRRTSPSEAIDRPVSFPSAGPLTEESAIEDTRISAQSGRSGAYIERLSTRWEPTEASAALAHRFRDMVDSDYGRRCQICGNTFSTTSGLLQVYVVHVVPPSEDHLTNHFGNLLGLCGWHYSLIRYNRNREFLNIRSNRPFDSWEDMRNYVLEADLDVDEVGNSYFSLGIRFPDVYPLWSSEATTQDAVIRYSEPHWKHLRKFLAS